MTNREMKYRIIAGTFLLTTCGFLLAQGLDRATLLKQPVDLRGRLTTGDYSARRFSTLKQINSTNVHLISPIFWMHALYRKLPKPAAGGRGAVPRRSCRPPSPASKPRRSWSTASSISQPPTTHGPSMPATAASSGTTRYPPSNGSTIGNRGMVNVRQPFWLFMETPR